MWIVLGALACAVALALPAAAVGAEDDIEDAFVSFTAKGTNGYSMLGFVAPEDNEPVGPGGKRKGTALILLTRQHSAAVYIAPASLTADFVEGRPTVTSFQVSLGKEGQLALDFKPSGGTGSARARCRRAPLVYAAGSYEGTLEFHGKQNFTEINATSVPQRPDDLLNFLCRSREVNEASGPRLPGAKLEVSRLELGATSVGILQLQLNKNNPRAKVHVVAGALEEEGRIEIVRSVEMDAPAGAFSFDRRLQHARVRLGAPFAGRAVYQRAAKPRNRWRGNLTVDLPGRSNLRLVGPGFDATLEHAVRRVGPPGAARIARTLRRFVP